MTFDVTCQNHLLARAGVSPRWGLWVAAKAFTTLAPAPLGLWSGEDHATLMVEGAPRTYLGAQGSFEIEPIVTATGTDVRTLRITLSAISPEAEDLVRGFVVRLAPVELHLFLLDPLSGALIGSDRRFKGYLNRAPIQTPALGGGSPTITLELVSSMRLLTRTMAVKKTDQSQQLRSGDRFRRYGSIAAQVRTDWARE
jgi:hypothetical protein